MLTCTLQGREQSLPRIVVYLCEYLLMRGARKAEKSSVSVTDDLLAMMQDTVDDTFYRSARERFNIGDFFDCESPPCMFRLLKGFIRELPAPLVPRVQHDIAIDIAAEHIRGVVKELRSKPNFGVFIAGFSKKEDDEQELHNWCTSLSGDQVCDLSEHLKHASVQIKKVIEAVAFSVCNSMPTLAEFFFGLPRVNRDVLEYLSVCCVKLDLMSRRGIQHDAMGSDQETPILHAMAETFAPHILKPAVWKTGGGVEKLRRKKLQVTFFMTFLFFVKRKHNLMTANERSSMDQADDAQLDKLLFEMAAVPAKLDTAFSSAISAEGRVTPSIALGLSLAGSRPHSPVAAKFRLDNEIREVVSPPVIRQMIEAVSRQEPTASVVCVYT